MQRQMPSSRAPTTQYNKFQYFIYKHLYVRCGVMYACVIYGKQIIHFTENGLRIYTFRRQQAPIAQAIHIELFGAKGSYLFGEWHVYFLKILYMYLHIVANDIIIQNNIHLSLQHGFDARSVYYVLYISWKCVHKGATRTHFELSYYFRD